jgi:type IV pilus assembly protein PilC
MSKYSYVAVDPDGGTATGVEKADSRYAVELALYEREFRDIKVTERRSPFQVDIGGSSVKRADIMHVSRQLAAFIRAGLPIIDSVHTLASEAANTALRRVMEEVEQGLRSGETLPDCFDKHPKVFPDFYRGILRSAELTGELDTVLDQLAVYLERDVEARRKVKAALVYPAVIAVMSLVTVVVLATFVLPKFKLFFSSLDAKLPLATRIMLAVTDFLTQWWWAIAIVFASASLAIVLALRTVGGRLVRDKLALATPVLGETIQYALVERFCRILASMVAAGVPLPEALRVASDSLNNLVYQRALMGVCEAVLEGEGLAAPLRATKLFPTTASQMMRVGEETGSFDSQLAVTAEYYEAELNYKITKLTSLFEPAVIIVMGLVVGFVAVALVSAMYGVFGQVKI